MRGIFTLNGNETLSLANSSQTGTVVYAGSGTYTGLAMGTSYYNMTFNSGTYNLNSGYHGERDYHLCRWRPERGLADH